MVPYGTQCFITTYSEKLYGVLTPYNIRPIQCERSQHTQGKAESLRLREGGLSRTPTNRSLSLPSQKVNGPKHPGPWPRHCQQSMGQTPQTMAKTMLCRKRQCSATRLSTIDSGKRKTARAYPKITRRIMSNQPLCKIRFFFISLCEAKVKSRF